MCLRILWDSQGCPGGSVEVGGWCACGCVGVKARSSEKRLDVGAMHINDSK